MTSQQTPAIAPDDKKRFLHLTICQGYYGTNQANLKQLQYKVSLKPHHTIGNLFPKPKDPVSKDQTHDAIYSIPCQVCDKSCIGETKRKFSTWLKEHQKAVVNKHSRKSVLAEHCLHSGHTIS